MKTVGNGFHKTSKLVWRNKGVNQPPCSNPSPYFQFLEGCWRGPRAVLGLGTYALGAGLGLLMPPGLGCVSVGVLDTLRYFFSSLKLWQNPAKDTKMIWLVTWSPAG